ncbi:hypothetical protein [Caulobacter sp. Root655]|uniref:ORC-CDC6 family AAA ATPase n=1 Tax=Caulobacter sp. Root655 TaxID=1736578 RepID=UPI0009E76AB7|nr:hypothetical protein [Caulobacter sp. Root655]
MSDFFYRTEDIKPEEVGQYFAETSQDRVAVNALKSRNPAIIVGSRGVGKSFLLRIAQKELMDSFDKDRIFPIYVSFVRSSLIQSDDEHQFRNWMLARLCSVAIRSLERAGLLGAVPASIGLLAGSHVDAKIGKTKVEEIASAYEESYKRPTEEIDASAVPSTEDFRDAFEDLSDRLNIERFVFLIDEAAHIFLPEHQRQFFTLFRDLRSHCLTCNAAVYPGVTSFGETFQPTHDASLVHIDRDVLDPRYVENMREIVEKQADSTTQKRIAQNGKNFAILAYACSGNPRILLKTLAAAPSLSSTEINEVMRDHYRTTIWSEHSALAEKYYGHRNVIDWGREFVESTVIPEIKTKNDSYLASDRNTSAYFWIHRDAPEVVKESLRILCYTGVLNEMEAGIRATRSEIGKRYMVNLGCLFAVDASPTTQSFEIAKSLTPKRMTEYGANHPLYKNLLELEARNHSDDSGRHLERQLAKPIQVLDLTVWQKEKLTELELTTVGDVLNATEEQLKLAKYVGDVRARRMRNAAVAAVLEYLSG